MFLRKLLFLILLLSAFTALWGSHTSAQTDLPSSESASATPGEWLGLFKRPTVQYVKRGDPAVFEISVFNTDKNFAMQNVIVSDETAPGCALVIGDLAPSDDYAYSCRFENVQVPFTNEAVVTGSNATNGKQDSASDTARVEVLDLTTVLTVEPEFIAAPGGRVTFSVAVANGSSVDVQLTMLDSPQFGDLSDQSNESVSDNTCASASGLPRLAKDGGSFNCAFSYLINETTGEHSYTVSATAEAAANAVVEDSGTAVVNLFDVIGLTLTPEADSAVSGGSVNLTAVVHNVDENWTVNVLSLEDADLGDVRPFGDCSLPQTLLPGESYSCSYEQQVSAAPGDEQIYNLSVTAETVSVPPVALSAKASANVLAAAPEVYLPILSVIPRPTSCATPLRISIDETYLFYPDTRNAVYLFVLTEEARTTVKLTNFVPQDGQVTVYQDTGNGCDPDTLTSVGYDGTNNVDRTLPLGTLKAGNYYIHVYSGSDQSDKEAYSLIVQTQ